MLTYLDQPLLLQRIYLSHFKVQINLKKIHIFYMHLQTITLYINTVQHKVFSVNNVLKEASQSHPIWLDSLKGLSIRLSVSFKSIAQHV